MKKICILCILAVLCVLASCQSSEQPSGQVTETPSTEHSHVPDGADCQTPQYCTDCGELIAEHGAHDYPDEPDSEQDGFSYYVCRVCGMIRIVNQNGAPIVPIG